MEIEESIDIECLWAKKLGRWFNTDREISDFTEKVTKLTDQGVPLLPQLARLMQSPLQPSLSQYDVAIIKDTYPDLKQAFDVERNTRYAFQFAATLLVLSALNISFWWWKTNNVFSDANDTKDAITIPVHCAFIPSFSVLFLFYRKLYHKWFHQITAPVSLPNPKIPVYLTIDYAFWLSVANILIGCLSHQAISKIENNLEGQAKDKLLDIIILSVILPLLQGAIALAIKVCNQ